MELDFISFHWFSVVLTGSYWVLLGFNEFQSSLSEFQVDTIGF